MPTSDTINLDQVIDLVSATLAVLDAEGPRGGGRFRPGIGPLTESELTTALCRRIAPIHPRFREIGPCRYSGSRAQCDLVIRGCWAIEIKLARPFGDNGKPAERWSENLLYPYPGNTSAIGDAQKLRGSRFAERRAVMVIGYEHSPPVIALETAVRGFELLARDVVGLELSERLERVVTGLVHPVHQQARVYSWEVLGSASQSALGA